MSTKRPSGDLIPDIRCDMDEKTEEIISDVQDMANDSFAAVKAQAEALCKSAEDYARREPMNAMLIVGGIGLIAGVLLARR
jgi:ElaB/YqjD/DUF883 family membrane-anchored ribosome-binding protein